MNKISIIGCGFVGKGVYHGFSPYFDIKIYDKYVEGYNTLEDTINHSDILFVCIPTPYKPNYEQDLSCIYDVINSIQKITNESKIVIVKSTIIPGTSRKLQNEFPNLRFVFNPEFLTERTFLNDFLNQTRIILGGKDSNDPSLKIVEDVYKIRFKATPVLKVKFEEAELVKYMCNCYFATKVIFLNQIYKICENIGIEYETVRQLFVGDQRITDSHTKVPGFDQKLGVGGKCVIPESLLLKDDGRFITIKGLYHKFIRHHKMPKIQSCNSDCNKLDFKNIKHVTRRKAIEEELLIFETESGKFTCSKEHLIPIYRNNTLIVVQAKDILESDEVVISDEKIYCCQGCGREAKYILSNKPWCEKFAAQCPVMKKRNSEGVRKVTNTSEYRSNQSKRMRKICRTDEYRQNMSNVINKLYKDPELNLNKKVSEGVIKAFKKDSTNRTRQAKTMKERNRNCGDSNGMKKPEARDKVSKSRKKMFEDPEERKKVAKSTAKAWVDGKFDGVKTGRCKWYKYEHSNKNTYKVQGTWELAFIKWLDKNNISFKCHKGRISYFFNGIERSYYPDFWIDDWNCYVDVKCEQFYNKEKMTAIKNCNPTVNVKVLFSNDLKKLGVILNEKTKDFKNIEC